MSVMNPVASILSELHDELIDGKIANPLELTSDKDANDFLLKTPLAFLLAVIADYGVHAERAWLLPHQLYKRLGHLDPAEISGMSPDGLAEILKNLGARFPHNLAKFYIEACKTLLSTYQGDADQIWSNQSVLRTVRNLEGFKGIGQKKSSMAVNILANYIGKITPEKAELKDIDVSYDVHVRRVFLRTGLVDHDGLQDILQAARKLSPDYPGRLDFGTWYAGREWCHANAPECESCRLTEVCPKLTDRNVAVGKAITGH